MPGAELLTGHIGGPLPTFGGVGTLPFGRAWDPVARKAKPAAHLKWDSWMLQYAEITREENAKFVGIRRGNVGQVQVGLNVDENEEDCYEWVEEEYSDHEEEEQQAAAAAADGDLARAVKSEPTPAPSIPPATPAVSDGMQLDSATTPSLSADFGGLPALPPLASTSSAVPSPLSAAHFPASAATTMSAGNEASPSIAAATPPPPRPKKRRMVRSYIPIRGLYDPETNVPHVYRATQAREVIAFERVSKLPRLGLGLESDQSAAAAAASSSTSTGLNGASDNASVSAERLRAAARAGVASVEVVSDERAWALETGGRTIDDALASRRGRENVLLPGMWDFVALAKAEGLVP